MECHEPERQILEHGLKPLYDTSFSIALTTIKKLSNMNRNKKP